MGKYYCGICDKVSNQKSHHEAHLQSELHLTKVENFRLKLEQKRIDEILKEYPEYKTTCSVFTNEDYLIDGETPNDNITAVNAANIKLKFDLIEKIIVSKTTKNIYPTEEIIMNSNISNSEALKEKIHEIHNFLRNNGAGYGMAALKVFNIFYGLKRIEENKLFDKLDLSEECKFSYLLEKSKGDDDELADIIYKQVLDSLSNSSLKYFLFYEIPRNMKGKIFSHLINELDKLTDIEKSSGEQLTGKIYEYFIGRDRQAISELGAYFTNRLIVEYIYKQLELEREEDGSIGTMVDPFGGSGGFTTGYINWMKNKYPDIDWSSEINKIHHYDMNEDVIKSAALEFFCITGEVPNMEHLQYKNSFADEFNDQQFKYCITNPPYGGDKNNKSDAEKKREKIKKYIKEELKTLTDKGIIKRRNEQLKHIDNLNKLEKKRQDEQKVTLDKSSMRIKKFAKKYGLKGNDKEAVSLMLMMDMVEEGGIGCGVLKEGVFTDRKYKELRKCLLENYNVTKVISVPRDQFENTSTKTSIVILKNDEEKTSSVQFYDLSCVTFDKDKLEEIGGHIVLTENEGDVKGVEDKLISIANVKDILNQKDVSLNGKEYNKIKITPGDEYELIKLDTIIEIIKTDSIIYNKKNKYDGKYNNYTCSPYIKKIDRYNIDGEYVLMGTRGTIEDSIHYYNGKFSVGNNMIVFKSNNLKFMYFILTVHKELIRYTSNCTTIPMISNSQFKNMEISIPKEKQKMIEWSDKISEPYNEKLDKEQRIKELEKQLQERVQYISENEDCEEKKIDELCMLAKGKGITKKERTGGDYPYYASNGQSNNTFMNEVYKPYEDFILYAEDGTIGAIHHIRGNDKIWVGDHVHVINSLDIPNEYIYNLLKMFDIKNFITGSVIDKLNNTNLKKIKLKIPKNKQLIQDMEPHFQELEQLHVDVKNADKKYKDLIEELKNEAIKQ
jgi:type I restriction-modification system DNA methylase subunit